MPVELDIAGNFAKGAQVRHTARRARQVEQAIDLELGDASDKQTSRRNLYQMYERSQGREPAMDFHQGLQDPFGERFLSWWQNRRQGQMGAPTPTPGAPPVEGALPLDQIPGYADGGMVDPLKRPPPPPAAPAPVESPQARAAQARARTPATVASSTQTLPRPTPPPAAKPSWLSRTLRFAGGAARRAFTTPVPLATAALELATPHTVGSGELSPEQMAEQERLGAEQEAARGGEVAPEAVAAPDQALALDAEAERAPLPEMSQQDQGPPVEGEFDWSTVDAMPDEMPNMTVRDWADYRSRAVGEMMRGGVSEKEANDQVTSMQHSGFMALGQEALALMQSNDLQSAAKALKAAYQYFPNGADVSFGIQGENLVGMGKDEATGKPVGKPMVLNAERLSVMLQNFAQPGAFATWTKDNRAEARSERTYQEITKPTAEASARAGQTNAQANLIDARSNAAYRASGSGRTDPGPDDRRAMEGIYREELAAMGMTDETVAEDPTILPRLASIASQIRAQIPDTQQLPDNELLELVMSHHRAGTLDGIAQQFGLR